MSTIERAVVGAIERLGIVSLLALLKRQECRHRGNHALVPHLVG
jgi:hypothetical protein